MKKWMVISMLTITFFLRETGEEYGGHVVQIDLWKSQNGQVWSSRDGEPPPEDEIGPNAKYLYTNYFTSQNQLLIPKLKR